LSLIGAGHIVSSRFYCLTKRCDTHEIITPRVAAAVELLLAFTQADTRIKEATHASRE